MKKLRLGINGFGRIGRIAARIISQRNKLQLVTINSRADVASHAYLLKYDSTYGTYLGNVKVNNGNLEINGNLIHVYKSEKPSEIPWQEAGVDIVIEATGKFRTTKDMEGHLKKGVKYVVLSSPAKDATPTYILGVNHESFNADRDRIISNSSCTTNCLATTLKVLHDAFWVKRAFMTTIHAVTDSQNLLDNSSQKEVRLRRSAFASMIPSTTGSAHDIGKLFPQLAGKIICGAIRVPLFTVSLLNLIAELEKKVSAEKINTEFSAASNNSLKGILSVADTELVSKDYTGSPYSSIIDPFLTRVNQDNLINVSAWYDNEWGYTSRLVDLIEYIAAKSKLI